MDKAPAPSAVDGSLPDFVDLDEGSNEVRRFRVFNNGLVELKAETKKSFRHRCWALLAVFLPAGFPHTVTGDYVLYQLFDSLQAFSSSIASMLASRAVLTSLGVGSSDSDATGALIISIAHGMLSRLACILFAHRFGQSIEPECKMYRFLADIFNDMALCLDLLTPIFAFWPRMGLMAAAGVLRALCGVAAGASKATLSAHFALNGNLAELNAKEASQETVISLVGMLAGTGLVRVVREGPAVWIWMAVLLSMHLGTNYMAVCAVEMDTLNRQRATIVYRVFCDGGKKAAAVPGPKQVARMESILFDSSTVVCDRKVFTRPEFATDTADFIRRAGPAAVAHLVASARSGGGRRMISLTPPGARDPVLLLGEGVESVEIARSFFESLYPGSDKDNERYLASAGDLAELEKGLAQKGWKFDPVALIPGRAAKHGARDSHRMPSILKKDPFVVEP